MRGCSFRTVLALFGLAAVLLAGCVERKLTVTTEPPGAIVKLNDEEIGTSPVTVRFKWYGDYKILIQKPGYETINTHRKLEGPRHDHFPFDFFAETLTPEQIVDSYEWHFDLEPYEPMDRERLIDDAESLRYRAVSEFIP